MADLLRRGRDAESNGDAAGARAAYERACLLYKDHSAPWAHLGEYHRFWGRDADAAWDAYDRAMRAPSPDAHWIAYALRGKGELARSERKIERALDFFEASLDRHPLPETHRSLSALHATERRDFEKAAHHARAAVELSPEDPIALLQFAVQMVRFGKPGDGDAAFAKAVRLAGCDDRGRSNDLVHCCVLYNGACYHAVRGDRPRALAMLEEFFRTPNHRHITKEEILRDPDFESLVNDPKFKALLDYQLPED